MIFCANPRAQYLPYRDEITEAVQKVLDSGNYILGEEVGAFEREFAQFLGGHFAVGCGNGRDAQPRFSLISPSLFFCMTTL